LNGVIVSTFAERPWLREDSMGVSTVLRIYSMQGQWQSIDTAPYDRDLELAVIDGDGPHSLAFACRRTAGGWIGAQTKQQIDVRPTHWREWKKD
jgi:hypothetical protein